jgi:YidC/Oxa1 family membrane protein insertase
LEQNDLNQRLILALVLSFAILFGFSYFFPQQKPHIAEQNASHQTTAAHAAASQASPAAPAASDAAAASTPQANPTSGKAIASAEKALVQIHAPHFNWTIDTLGRISSAQLLEKKYHNPEGKPLELFDPTQTRPLEVRFADGVLNAESFKVHYTASASSVDLTAGSGRVTLTQPLSGLTLTKTFTFYPDGHYDVTVATSKPVPFFVTPGHRPEADHSRYLLVRGVLVRDSKGVITTIEDKKAEETLRVPDATILSAFDRYTATLFYDFDHPMDVTVSPEKEHNPLGFVAATGSIDLHGYIGPKEYRTLQALHPKLTDAIEFGWFTFLSRPFFKVMVWIHDYVGNWGWAIVLFTLLVKLVLFPLSYKGMMSMQKLKDLAPKMKELKEKYKGDPAKLNMHMMELYKKHGANPMGGCLPMILQIPVFFALYRVLLNADELQGAPWIGWITNLADKDPYYILPILMGVTMWLMQKIQPNTMTDPMQKKIFQWFPVIMTFFFLTFPAGLVLYWLTNNILSIIQQYIINRAYENHKNKMKTGTAD